MCAYSYQEQGINITYFTKLHEESIFGRHLTLPHSCGSSIIFCMAVAQLDLFLLRSSTARRPDDVTPCPVADSLILFIWIVYW